MKQNVSTIIYKYQSELLSVLCTVGLLNVFFRIAGYRDFTTTVYATVCFCTIYPVVRAAKKSILPRGQKYVVIVFAVALSLILISGYSIITNQAFLYGLTAKEYLQLCFNAATLSYFLYCCIKHISTKLTTIQAEHIHKKQRPAVNVYFFSLTILVIIYGLYFIAFYPGIMTYDSLHQWRQMIGDIPMTNQHPVVHTLIIAFANRIANLFTSDANVAIAIYSILQLLINAAIFSWCVAWIYDKTSQKVLPIAALACYALIPIHAYYSITMWKDVLFSTTLLAYVIVLAELALQKDDYFKKNTHCILFVLVSFLTGTLRNNGHYVISFMTILLVGLTALRKGDIRKKFLAIALFIIPALMIQVVLGPIYTALNFTSSSAEESLSIPIQQIARVIVLDGEMTPLQEERLHELISPSTFDDIKENYNPILSDPMKKVIRHNAHKVKEHPLQYLELWGGLLIKNPAIYIDAYINQTYGFTYPIVSRYIVEDTIHPDAPSYGIYQTRNEALSSFLIAIKNYSERRPIINLAMGVGTYSLLTFFFFMIAMFRKNFIGIPAYCAIFALIVTIMVSSPLNGECRYLYGVITCLPISFALPFVSLKLSEMESSKKESKRKTSHSRKPERKIV